MASVLELESKTSRDKVRLLFDTFDVDGSGALSIDELRVVLQRPGGGDPLSDAEVAEIIQEFDANGDGELQFDEFAAMWGAWTNTGSEPAVPSVLAMSRNETQESLGSSRPVSSKSKSKRTMFEFMTGTVNSIIGHGASSFRHGSASFRRGQVSFRGSLKKSGTSALSFMHHSSKRGSEYDSVRSSFSKPVLVPEMTRTSMRSSSALESMALEQEEAAASMEMREDSSLNPEVPKKGTFAARLGSALADHNVAQKARRGSSAAMTQLVREWDKNGDGEISSIEFRQAVRLTLKVKGSDAEINAVFNEFDADRSGLLTMEELKPCLTHLARATRDDADSRAAAEETKVRLIREHRAYAEKLKEVAQKMAELEASEKSHDRFQRSLPFASRVGLGLLKTKKNLAQLIKTWPDAVVGYATLESFQKGMSALEVPGGYTKGELVSWFNAAFEYGLEKAFCREGGGIQLKHDLTTLLKEGRAAMKEEKRLETLSEEALNAGKIAMGDCLVYEAQMIRRMESAEHEARAKAEAADESFKAMAEAEAKAKANGRRSRASTAGAGGAGARRGSASSKAPMPATAQV